jgi:hypothetical protein
MCRAQTSNTTLDGDGSWVQSFEFGANLPLAYSFVMQMNSIYHREAASNSLADHGDVA